MTDTYKLDPLDPDTAAELEKVNARYWRRRIKGQAKALAEIDTDNLAAVLRAASKLLEQSGGGPDALILAHAAIMLELIKAQPDMKRDDPSIPSSWR